MAVTAGPAAGEPGKRPKRRASWAADVQDHETPAALEDAPEPQVVRLGLLRLGNTYQASVELPAAAAGSPEVLPFLSTALSAEVGPGSVAASASLRLTYTASREGRFAEGLRVRLPGAGPAGQPEPRELKLRVEGAVMARDAGKPLPRRGVVLLAEGRPSDVDTEAETTWEGFGAGAAAD